MRVYVASSWRNVRQPSVVYALRDAGHEVYDFRQPGGQPGFGWSAVDPRWKDWTASQYMAALDHPEATRGFRRDLRGMRWADACVLVLPCGRSAHLEAGWFVGAGKRLAILLDAAEYGTEAATADLMYKLGDVVGCDVADVLAWL